MQTLLRSILALALAASTALAGFTGPTLTLSRATGASGDGARGARFEGSFDFPNAVQADYSLHLVVFQGTTFVRFPVTGGPVSGTSATLADGILDADETPALLAADTPAPAGIRIVQIAANGITVTLPPALGPGPTRALLVAVLADHPVFSNPIDFTLP